MAQTVATIFRDFAIDGVPSSGAHNPKKAEIREWGAYVEQLHAAAQAGGGVVFQTKAAMTLGYAVNQIAWVIGDATAANNGIYQKQGTSGAGSWVRVGELPYSIIRASNTGAGTPNAIKSTSVTPIPAADGAALITVNVTDQNTGPATIVFNGGPPLAIKTNSAHDVATDGLLPGMILAGYVSGSTFRLLTDQASAAIQAAAEAAQAAATSSAADAVASEALAKKWATEAEDVEVAPGLFSGRHWAAKAASYVLGSISAAIHVAPAKATPADADEFGYAASADGLVLVKITWANIKASLRTHLDALYMPLDPWVAQPIGVPIPVFDHIAGVSAPPTNKDYRFIKLTAGESGAGGYNAGVLISESVTGSAPLVSATATVSLEGSPVNGRSVRLINTERRMLRAGSSGTVEQDALQEITGTFEVRSASNNPSAIGGDGAFVRSDGIGAQVLPATSAPNQARDRVTFTAGNVARTATETRAKNIGVTYYMRIK